MTPLLTSHLSLLTLQAPDEEGDIRKALAKRPYGVISDQPIRARQLRGQ